MGIQPFQELELYNATGTSSGSPVTFTRPIDNLTLVVSFSAGATDLAFDLEDPDHGNKDIESFTADATELADGLIYIILPGVYKSLRATVTTNTDNGTIVIKALGGGK